MTSHCGYSVLIRSPSACGSIKRWTSACCAGANFLRGTVMNKDKLSLPDPFHRLADGNPGERGHRQVRFPLRFLSSGPQCGDERPDGGGDTRSPDKFCEFTQAFSPLYLNIFIALFFIRHRAPPPFSRIWITVSQCVYKCPGNAYPRSPAP
ncbi:Uncharacterised protein [Citrobacter koseri]|uniref:Uncharacterized protein n=1 Tax=Citrobacter koseri TaxID=545 RepID=A0A2X2YNX4_CITKO|nr:Uncharacterised protein [Citrobacter koseri]